MRLVLASFRLLMASLAVAAVGLVEPAQADSPSAATRQPDTSLTIRIENVSPKGGILRLGLYDAQRYSQDKDAIAAADVTAMPGETVVTLHNLAPGTYAVETFQDINSNGEMDKSWIGLPLEPYGFSRDVRPFLSKPPFAKVSFAILPGANSQTLHLQNVQQEVASSK